jgi:hypothetical protein
MSDTDNGNSGAEDQNEKTGDELDNKDDTDTGSDDGSQDNSGDDDKGGDDAGDDTADTRFKDQQKRAKNAETERNAYRQRLIDAGLDPDTGKPKEKSTPKKGENDERLTAAEERAANAETRAQRAELRSLGITHPDDLALVQKAAKELGIDPVDAADRKYVKAELEEQREARRTRDAAAPPKKGNGGSGGNDVSKLADKVAAGGELPKDPALAEKVQKELARRSQAGS